MKQIARQMGTHRGMLCLKQRLLQDLGRRGNLVYLKQQAQMAHLPPTFPNGLEPLKAG